MGRIEDEKFKVKCPGPKCGKEIEVKNRDVVSSRRIRCQRCGTEVTIDSTAAQTLHRAIGDMTRAVDNIATAQENILDRAQVKTRA